MTNLQWDRIRGIAGPDKETRAELEASLKVSRPAREASREASRPARKETSRLAHAASVEASMRATPALTQRGPSHNFFSPIGAVPLVCEDISDITFAGRGSFMVIERYTKNPALEGMQVAYTRTTSAKRTCHLMAIAEPYCASRRQREFDRSGEPGAVGARLIG